MRHPSKWRLCAGDAEFVPDRLPDSFVVTSHLPGAPLRRCGCRSRAVRRARREGLRDRRGLARSRPRSVGGPRGGESGGGSSRSPRWVRIFRVDHGSPTGSPQQPECAKSPKVTDGFALGEQSERDEPDVTPVPRARERKLLAHPRGYPVIPMLMLCCGGTKSASRNGTGTRCGQAAGGWLEKRLRYARRLPRRRAAVRARTGSARAHLPAHVHFRGPRPACRFMTVGGRQATTQPSVETINAIVDTTREWPADARARLTERLEAADARRSSGSIKVAGGPTAAEVIARFGQQGHGLRTKPSGSGSASMRKLNAAREGSSKSQRACRSLPETGGGQSLARRLDRAIP